MIIGVFGNICAGKSTFASTLRERLPEYPLVSIDEYRRRLGDGSFEADQVSMDQFVARVSELVSAIVECTGLGPLGEKLVNALPAKSTLIVHVIASLQTCIHRVRKKDFKATPYPTFSESLEQTVVRIDTEIQQGFLEELWKEKGLFIQTISGEATKTTVESEQCVRFIAISHYELVSRLSQAFLASNQINTAIWFGSGPRGEFTNDSDIDLFVQTAMSPEKIERLVRDNAGIHPVFSDVISKKLWLETETGIIVEIYFDTDITAVDHLLCTSDISDSRWCILVGDKAAKTHIDSIMATSDNALSQAEIEDLLGQVIYYLVSLKALIRKDDCYKYYFHSNILLHRIVQLRAIELGATQRYYLPLNADSSRFFERKGELAGLGYVLGEDMEKHRSKIWWWVHGFLQKLSISGVKTDKYLEYLSRYNPCAY